MSSQERATGSKLMDRSPSPSRRRGSPARSKPSAMGRTTGSRYGSVKNRSKAEPDYRSAAYYSWRVSIHASQAALAARRAREAAADDPTVERLAAAAEVAAASAHACWQRSHEIGEGVEDREDLHGWALGHRLEAERLAAAA